MPFREMIRPDPAGKDASGSGSVQSVGPHAFGEGEGGHELCPRRSRPRAAARQELAARLLRRLEGRRLRVQSEPGLIGSAARAGVREVRRAVGAMQFANLRAWSDAAFAEVPVPSTVPKRRRRQRRRAR